MLDDILCKRAEEACLNAWPAIKEVFYDDWLIRFAAGQTRRTNSVNVIGPGRFAVDTKIGHCEQLYRAYGQRAYFRILPMRDGNLDSRLAERGYRKEGETLTLFMDFARETPAEPGCVVELHEELPTREWRQAHTRLSGRTQAEGFVLNDVLNLLAIPSAFAAVRDETGAIASVAFGAIHAGMVCLQWVVTAEAARVFAGHDPGPFRLGGAGGRIGCLPSGCCGEFPRHPSLFRDRVRPGALSLSLSGGMNSEVLSVQQSYDADRYAAAHGVPTLTLMENAGAGAAREIARRWLPRKTVVLCGPGNNGGDGFVIARHLKAMGWSVRLALLGDVAALKGDAAAMAQKWDGPVETIAPDVLGDAALVVDALFGAGLSRPLSGAAKAVVKRLNAAATEVVAIDVPSGLHGDLGKALGDCCIDADLTITFFRKKPAHVLMPGRMLCGYVAVIGIGIPDTALSSIRPNIFENTPSLWGKAFPWPDPMGHKYGRGHAVAVSGPAHATGAARLAARGALRVGAGLVSVASPQDAVIVNAAALTAIMVKPFDGAAGLASLLEDKRLNAVVIGPGCSVGQATRDMVAAVLGSGAAAVLDADALTSFSQRPATLFGQLREPAVLTPHEGEFARIFPGVLAQSSTRIEAAGVAAAMAHCTVLLKGPDSVIAGADGRAAVCTNAPPWLATAGAGDVLAGMITGLLAQGMQSFEATAAAAWLHGEAARIFGPGLIAEDLPEQLPAVLASLKGVLQN